MIKERLGYDREFGDTPTSPPYMKEEEHSKKPEGSSLREPFVSSKPFDSCV